jgi:hypothetical protein
MHLCTVCFASTILHNVGVSCIHRVRERVFFVPSQHKRSEYITALTSNTSSIALRLSLPLHLFALLCAARLQLALQCLLLNTVELHNKQQIESNSNSSQDWCTALY